MALNHASYVSATCPFDPYRMGIFFMFLTPLVSTICGIIIAVLVMRLKSNGSYERYLPTCKVLEEILAKTDLEERNEAFLGACVEYSKRQVGKKEPVFDREYGLGKSEEVYRHFIRMESKRLKGKGEEGEAGAVKVSQEKTVPEEKMANMV